MKTLTRLVQTTTEDDLILSGLYSEGDKSKPAVVSIHGFGGDFYTHKFKHDVADSLSEAGITNILVQTRGTGLFTELVSADRSVGKNYGSYYEMLEEAHLDISAWIDFLRAEGYTEIVLMGHSLGTIKSVRYLSEGKYKGVVTKLILLAPFDKNGYVENKTKGEWHEHLKVAEQKIAEGKALEIIPDTFDDFPMTYQNYYSWYRESDLNSLWDFYKPEYISPILQQVNIPVLIVIGDQDDVAYTAGLNGSIDKTVQYLKNNMKTAQIEVIKGADHVYLGKEEEVTKLISDFFNV